MEKIYCNICKYFTDNSSNMSKHKITKKHVEMLRAKETTNDKCIANVKTYSCKHCDKLFITRQAKSQHEHKCNKCANIINNGTISAATQQITIPTSANNNEELIAIMKNQITKYESFIGELITSNKSASDATNKTAEAANKSMSILKYATLNMTDAPPLTELNKNEAISILGYKGLDENLTDEQKEYENDMYVQSVIAHYINKNLVNFLGVMIAAYFRKPGDNLKKMSSVWAVDVARLSFIIMSTISKDGDKEWRSDKTGKSFTASVIKPMLVALNEITRTYIKYKENVHTKTNLTIEEMNKIMILRQGCVDLSKDIRYQRLEKPLLKAVAPSFQFEEFMKKTK